MSTARQIARAEELEAQAALIENVEWLLDSGEDLDRIAARVGRERATIPVILRRASRSDLLERWLAVSEKRSESLRAPSNQWSS